MKTLKLTIHEAEKKKINPYLFGNFIEHIENCIQGGIYDKGNPLSDETGIRTDVLEKCKELAPSILRFPGGTVIGIYHWEDHVGPVEKRKKMKNLVWGNNLCHAFGTAEFVAYCRAIGAEPMICINMPTGTPEEAAHWVEYCNGVDDTYYANLRRSHGYEQPFDVKYWCIGNESYSEPDLGMQENPEVYTRLTWEYIRHMKLTDNRIKIILVGANPSPEEDENGPANRWNKTVLDSLWRAADYLSVHCYFNATLEPEKDGDPLTYIANRLDQFGRMLDSYKEKDIPFEHWNRFEPSDEPVKLSLDEWGIWYSKHPDAGRYGLHRRYNWLEALWIGRFYNILINRADQVEIANFAQMVNVIAPIVAEKDGSYRQTVFYPLSCYRHMAGEYALTFETQGDGLDLCVTMDKDQIRVFAVNTSSEEVSLSLDREASGLTELSCGELLVPNTMEWDRVKVVSLPLDRKKEVVLAPYTINVIELPA